MAAIIQFTFLLLLISQSVTAQPAPYPAPGKLVDAGGYRVHLHCTGEGSPAVVVVGGGFSFDWDLVQTGAAKFTRVCTYDVSGNAWSDAGPTLTCPVWVNQIHRMLANASIHGPYALVGLSVGALVARLYASQYPSEVAGMVIVDHAFLNPSSDSPPTAPISVPGVDTPPVVIFQTPIVLTVEDTSNFSNLPAHDQELHRWAMSLKPALPTVEMAEACDRAAGAAPFGDKPLAVVSTGNVVPNYLKLQTKLLSLSRKSKQYIADQSVHSVEIDQPEVVVRAIREVVEAVRDQ